MAILIVEHNGTVEGASLEGRVLIGRRSSNHVVVDDPDVSRIHAWIDTAGHHFHLTDAGSRTGTYVNGHRVANNVALKHGDRIKIGPATLIFRTDSLLPSGVSQLDFNERAQTADGGIVFDCKCGAPLWVSSAFAGRMGKCRFCGTIVQVPRRPGVELIDDVVMPAAPPEPTLFDDIAPPATCGVCQSLINSHERMTTCPSCGLTFHTDCWTENYGCSAYGCAQVNALLPKTEISEAAPMDDSSLPLISSQPEVHHEAKLPVEYALLGVSVAGFFLGAFTFGLLALPGVVSVLLYLKRKGWPRRIAPVVLAAAILAVAGVVIGVSVSYIWWLRDAVPEAKRMGVWSN
jgi:pSer/pThr/pTyr-binding forkhead associated (FHA) protein